MASGLYLMVAHYGFDRFQQALGQVRWQLALALITLNVLAIFLVGWRLGILIEALSPGLGRTSISKINIVALASGYANIGKLNAPIKAILLKKLHDVPFSATMPVLVAEQALDLFALTFITVFALLLGGPLLRFQPGSRRDRSRPFSTNGAAPQSVVRCAVSGQFPPRRREQRRLHGGT